jgi:hypothetical protein
MFPTNYFGQYILKRKRVIQKVKDFIESQKILNPGEATSVYIGGCRGSGKTSLQMLLASSYKAEGYEVYFFKDAQDIPQGASLAFSSLLEDKTKKISVLIDEVANHPNSSLFTELLKGSSDDWIGCAEIYSDSLQVDAGYDRSGAEGGGRGRQRADQLLCGVEGHHYRADSDHLQVPSKAMRWTHLPHSGFH